jgi:hypothetical protein
MNTPAFRLNAPGKSSRFTDNPKLRNFLAHSTRLRLIAITTLICVIAAGTLSFAANTTGSSLIKFSKKSDRSGAVALHGATVSGDVYIFVPDNGYGNVAFFLDTNGNYSNSVMTSGHQDPPFDFAYTNQSDGTARAFNTKTLSDGKHVLAVTVYVTATKKYDRHIVTFYVKNTVTTTTAAPTTTVKPVTTLAPTTTVKPVTTTLPSAPVTTKTFAGDVGPGKVRWGSGGGNTDPVNRFGTELGNRLGLRRSFVSGWNPSSVVSLAKQDVAAGRLPWVSNKPAGSWKSHGDGQHDAATRQMFIDLGKLNGPVWYTFHHEPEGGGSSGNSPDDSGGPTQWIRAQERIGKILDDLQAQGIARNVAFGPVLMGYTWQKSSGRDPNAWFKAGIWDFAGIDAYTRNEGTSSPLASDGLPAARLFYKSKGLKVALGEWAIRTQATSETNAGEKPTAEEERIAGERMRMAYREMLASATDGKGAQIIGAAYFDTSLNSGAASYSLTGTQLSTFRELIALPTSIKANQS